MPNHLVPELTTERLLLRDWRDTDLEPLAEMNADPEVMRYVGDGKARTYEQSAAWLPMIREDWRRRGFGMFAVELRDTGELAGWAGFAVPTFLPEVLPAVEIGWRLRRGFWGRGFATEAAREALRFGFAYAGLEEVLSICHVDNHASVNVMRKIGLGHERLTTVPDRGTSVRVLSITRDDHSVEVR